MSVQALNQELQEVRSQLTTEQEKVVDLENKLRELKVNLTFLKYQFKNCLIFSNLLYHVQPLQVPHV